MPLEEDDQQENGGDIVQDNGICAGAGRPVHDRCLQRPSVTGTTESTSKVCTEASSLSDSRTLPSSPMTDDKNANVEWLLGQMQCEDQKSHLTQACAFVKRGTTLNMLLE